MPKKICNFKGCNTLISYKETYCDKHKINQVEANKERHKYYKMHRKDKYEQQLYNSEAWRIVRETIKGRDLGLCKLCSNNFMDLVHHIVELKEDRTLALEPTNLISLCDKCHKEVHRLYKTKDKEQLQQRLRKLI